MREDTFIPGMNRERETCELIPIIPGAEWYDLRHQLYRIVYRTILS